ncbi:MAG: thiopurine S-methyltransferase [Alcanivoracaceae bacterium]|jgi:thiopurine S-methyltransferase|nr:thiopurine S-methyltransferase [Alcanivoracaceae bacterium]
MEPDFWHARWQAGEIGFHLPRPHPKLCRYWSTLEHPVAADVLVPLCGKSLDMCWLNAQGHAVTGIELSQQALDAFVSEHDVPLVADAAGYHGNGWRLLCSDWFDFQAAEPFTAFYDRAALIALPPSLRRRYVDHLLGQLASGARGLLITLEYPQAQMDGPPFSVAAAEVRELFAGHEVTQLSRADILANEPRFAERGLEALAEVVWDIRIS